MLLMYFGDDLFHKIIYKEVEDIFKNLLGKL